IVTFRILSESGIAAGVRRIEAITADNVMAYYRETEDQLLGAAALLRTNPAGLAKRIETLLADLKALQSENEGLKAQIAKNAAGNIMDRVRDVNGVKVLSARMDNVDMNELRNLGDDLKAKLGDAVIVLASVADGKVTLMATASDGAVKRGAHAGNLIRAIAGLVGGGGGGRPNMAQAGGKNPAGCDEAVEKAFEIAASQIS
ncbi:MAG: alanine--tRNA ligase, partial [Lachnospiraceae bacterium]|nr:alanine--tRNA ligase [Lachnospiraceae bacterium]